ncbi:MAG: LysE family translocator [Burkholderiaceae bacterium]|nr:LysE family translocator [Burkholderiaceae bacterium]MBP8309340.1 LysE family translocator [Burkholderiaceae bacterium]
MTDLLPAGPLLLAFLLASLVLAITPGPGVLYVVTRTLAQGRRAGLSSVAGVALGNLGNALGASIGLAALFAVSSLAFTLVKMAGAAYLVYLGIRALRRPPPANGELHAHGPAPSPLARRLLRDGFVVALLNPKTAVFFGAFLPQFIDPTGSALVQSVAFGATFVLIAAVTDIAYVLAAATLAPAIGALGVGAALGRYATASVFIGLGIFTALSGTRART